MRWHLPVDITCGGQCWLCLWVWLSHRTYQVTCDAINHRMMCCQETELPPPVKKSKTEQLTKSLTTPSPSSSSSTTAVSASAHFTDTCADTSHTPSTSSMTTTPASSSSSSQGRVTTSQPPPQPSQSPATKVSSMMSISQPTKVEWSLRSTRTVTCLVMKLWSVIVWNSEYY